MEFTNLSRSEREKKNRLRVRVKYSSAVAAGFSSIVIYVRLDLMATKTVVSSERTPRGIPKAPFVVSLLHTRSNLMK